VPWPLAGPTGGGARSVARSVSVGGVRAWPGRREAQLRVVLFAPAGDLLGLMVGETRSYHP